MLGPSRRTLIVFFLCFLCGCSGEKKGTGEKVLKIAMVTDVGGVNDQSFNQSAWEGLTRAREEFGIGASYLESRQDADYTPNMETLLDAGNDLIWGIGYKMADKVLDVARFNPGQKLGIIDYDYGEETPQNLVGVLFREQEAAFLVGYIAGEMTGTGTIGFVGGMDVPVIHRFHYGFKAGVEHANPEAELLEQYAESFTDAARGKAIAKQMYKNGADIIFHAAGGVGDGVIEAAKEEDRKAIGVDRDQNDLAPDHVITSAMKRVDNAIYNVAKELKEGRFPGGKTVIYGLSEGGVDIAPTSDRHVPPGILDEVVVLKQKIIAGEIAVPANLNDYTTLNLN